MVTTELKTSMSTVRIHDDCFEAAADCISQASHIVSQSYRRRAQGEDNLTAGFDAAFCAKYI